jgi:hypothetical protein
LFAILYIQGQVWLKVTHLMDQNSDLAKENGALQCLNLLVLKPVNYEPMRLYKLDRIWKMRDQRY